MVEHLFLTPRVLGLPAWLRLLSREAEKGIAELVHHCGALEKWQSRARLHRVPIPRLFAPPPFAALLHLRPQQAPQGKGCLLLTHAFRRDQPPPA